MPKALLAAAVLSIALIAPIASAAMLESDWGPSVGGNGSLDFNSGRLNFVVGYSPNPNADFYAASAARVWQDGYLNFAEDWTLRVGLHLGANVEQVHDFTMIGVKATPLNWPHSYPGPKLGGVQVGYQSFMRGASSLYGMVVESGVDTFLVQTYSATDQIVRCFIKKPNGELEKFSEIDIGNYFQSGSVDPTEPFEVTVYAATRSTSNSDFTLGIGDVYIDSIDLERGLVTPEPNSVFGSIVAVLCIVAGRRLGRECSPPT